MRPTPRGFHMSAKLAVFLDRRQLLDRVDGEVDLVIDEIGRVVR